MDNQIILKKRIQANSRFEDPFTVELNEIELEYLDIGEIRLVFLDESKGIQIPFGKTLNRQEFFNFKKQYDELEKRNFSSGELYFSSLYFAQRIGEYIDFAIIYSMGIPSIHFSIKESDVLNLFNTVEEIYSEVIQKAS